TNVELSPAARFAALSPTRSSFATKFSWYFTAYALAVAALCARMTRNIEAAVASSPVVSPHVIPFGNPMCGSPLGTGPRTETPCDLKSKIQLNAIAPTTATRPPGTALIQRSNTIRVASNACDTASVAPDVWPTSFNVSQNLITVPLSRFRSTFGDATPSMPANCPNATWIPTPVRNPTSTVLEMKFARKPSRANRASTSKPEASKALRLANASHCDVFGCSPEIPSAAIPANMIAAVAESPPTTRCRDDAKTANARIGIRMV